IRSWRRMVEAPSTPSSSAIETSSAGARRFSSLRCISEFHSTCEGRRSCGFEKSLGLGKADLIRQMAECAGCALQNRDDLQGRQFDSDAQNGLMMTSI